MTELILSFAPIAEVILALRIALIALMTLAACYIIYIVLKQQGNSDGTAAFSGGGQNDTDSFYGKNKSKRVESVQKVRTIISGVVLALCSIAFFVLDII